MFSGRCNRPLRGLSPRLVGAGGVTAAWQMSCHMMRYLRPASRPRSSPDRHAHEGGRSGARSRDRGTGRAPGYTGAGHRSGVSTTSGPEPEEDGPGDSRWLGSPSRLLGVNYFSVTDVTRSAWKPGWAGGNKTARLPGRPQGWTAAPSDPPPT